MKPRARPFTVCGTGRRLHITSCAVVSDSMMFGREMRSLTWLEATYWLAESPSTRGLCKLCSPRLPNMRPVR